MPAATPDRIVGKIDASRTRQVSGNVHHLAQAKYDQGEADPRTPMNYMVMLLEPSSAQQTDLAQLVADQQNPGSPQYHKWLTPEAFGERFGLSHADLSKVSTWLKGEGFSIDRVARGGNWIAFSGTAAQTSRTFHTAIHRYSVNGESHFANAGDPRVPEALVGIVTAFLGLNDFPLQPASHLVTPEYNTAGQHFMAPVDFSTIYNLGPPQLAGLDGTGQTIAIVGQSDVFTSDLTNSAHVTV